MGTVLAEGRGRPGRPLAERLADRIDRRGPDQCWPWTGHRLPKGYGTAGVAGQTRLAHRLVYELAKGPIPEGMFVCHTCDNPPCCNPRHLVAETPQFNMDDKARKGRHVSGSAVGVIPLKKLTDAQLQDTLRRVATGETGASIAREFGVNRSTINGLLRRRGIARSA